ncbi:hypothetical protein [Actinokineospora auranticolor]|nr:hypothetical protein [Actinokineospora auranticolor]
MRRARRRRLERWLVVAAALVAAVAVVMLLVGVGVFDRSPKGDGGGGGGDAEFALPTVDANRPYAGTPAAGWADGADGVKAPPAMPVGEFTKDEVAQATALVRDVLIASRLDPAMLADHNPQRYLSLLAPDSRRQLQPLFGTAQQPQTQGLVSMIDKGSALLPVAPKVNGSMQVSAGGPGQLVVRTNYVFVYAFADDRQPKHTSAMDILVVVRADVEYKLLRGPHWTPGSQGLWYGEVGGYGYSISCDAYKRGFLAPAYKDPVATGGTGLGPEAYFDLNTAVPNTSGCPA